MAEPQALCFGPFVFEPHQARLRRGRRVLPLTRKACDVLQYLATHPGQMVTKEALFQAVWPDTAVSHAVLTNRSSSPSARPRPSPSRCCGWA
jgi:DNA-binding winged helix-turn-helix (wHTH) protein